MLAKKSLITPFIFITTFLLSSNLLVSAVVASPFESTLLGSSYFSLGNYGITSAGSEIQPQTHEVVHAINGDLTNFTSNPWYQKIIKQDHINISGKKGLIIRLDKQVRVVLGIRVLNEEILSIDTDERNGRIVALTKKGLYKFSKDLKDIIWINKGVELFADENITTSGMDFGGGSIDIGNDGTVAAAIYPNYDDNGLPIIYKSGWVSTFNPESGQIVDHWTVKKDSNVERFRFRSIAFDSEKKEVYMGGSYSVDASNFELSCDDPLIPSLRKYSNTGNLIWAGYENQIEPAKNCYAMSGHFIGDIELGRDGYLYAFGGSDWSGDYRNNVFNYDPLITNQKTNKIGMIDEFNNVENGSNFVFVGRYDLQSGNIIKGQFTVTSPQMYNYQMDVNSAGQIVYGAYFSIDYPGKGQLKVNNQLAHNGRGNTLVIELNQSMTKRKKVYTLRKEFSLGIDSVATRDGIVTVLGNNYNNPIILRAPIQPSQISFYNSHYFGVFSRE
jgi:hypothetical protein